MAPWLLFHWNAGAHPHRCAPGVPDPPDLRCFSVGAFLKPKAHQGMPARLLLPSLKYNMETLFLPLRPKMGQKGAAQLNYWVLHFHFFFFSNHKLGRKRGEGGQNSFSNVQIFPTLKSHLLHLISLRCAIYFTKHTFNCHVLPLSLPTKLTTLWILGTSNPPKGPPKIKLPSVD